MKKLSALLVLALALVACGGKEPVITKANYEHKFEGYNGSGSVYVNVELTDGVISAIEIDETYGDSTKKALEYNYFMAATSQAKGVITENDGEWFNQVKFLEGKLVGTDGKIALDESGYPTADEIKAGCTINLATIQEAITAAIAEAK